MTKTHRIKGKETYYKNPKGKCDMCNTNTATHWFGMTSVALCDDEDCAEKNQRKWETVLEEIDNES
jgi:hypothetical protein